MAEKLNIKRTTANNIVKGEQLKQKRGGKRSQKVDYEMFEFRILEKSQVTVANLRWTCRTHTKRRQESVTLLQSKILAFALKSSRQLKAAIWIALHGFLCSDTEKGQYYVI